MYAIAITITKAQTFRVHSLTENWKPGQSVSSLPVVERIATSDELREFLKAKQKASDQCALSVGVIIVSPESRLAHVVLRRGWEELYRTPFFLGDPDTKAEAATRLQSYLSENNLTLPKREKR